MAIAAVTVTVAGVAVAAAGTTAGDAEVQASAEAPVAEIDETTSTTEAVETTTTTAKPTTTTQKPTTTTTTAPPTTTTKPPAPATTKPPVTTPPAPKPKPAPTTTAAPKPPPTTKPPAPSTKANRSTSCESYMYNQINAARGNAGKGSLSFDTGIQYIAVNWSDHMAGTQVLAHNPNYGSQIGAVRNFRSAAENVGRGYQKDTLFQAFMNSSGHRANILGDFSHVTVGCVTDGNGQLWVTQNFWR